MESERDLNKCRLCGLERASCRLHSALCLGWLKNTYEWIANITKIPDRLAFCVVQSKCFAGLDDRPGPPPLKVDKELVRSQMAAHSLACLRSHG